MSNTPFDRAREEHLQDAMYDAWESQYEAAAAAWDAAMRYVREGK